jgi:hypothetical protein
MSVEQRECSTDAVKGQFPKKTFTIHEPASSVFVYWKMVQRVLWM